MHKIWIELKEQKYTGILCNVGKKKKFLGLCKHIWVDIRNYIITLLIHSEQFIHIPGTHITLLMNMEEYSYYQHIDYIITNDYTADKNEILSFCCYSITHDYNADRYGWLHYISVCQLLYYTVMITLVTNMDECASFPNVEYIIKHDYIADICRLISVPLSKNIMFTTLFYINTLW